jgi:hypothetical protein
VKPNATGGGTPGIVVDPGRFVTSARDQLGLTLQAQRVPVDVLAVDRAELSSLDPTVRNRPGRSGA